MTSGTDELHLLTGQVSVFDSLNVMQLLAGLPAPGVLIFFMIGFWRGWWVFGWQYDDLKGELEDYKDAALESTDLASAYHDRVIRHPRNKTRKRTR